MRARVLAILLVLVLVAGLAGSAWAQADKERIGWLIADKATVVNSMDVLGPTSFADTVAITGAMSVAGATNSLIDATIITTDTVLTAADSNGYIAFKNQDTFQVTATLPAAAAGLNFCFYNYDGDDVQVDAPAADQINHYTSATGEEIDNTAAGDWICLAAIDATDWVAYSIEGSWADD